MFQVSFLGLLVKLNIFPGLFIDYIFLFLNCLFPSFAHTSAGSCVFFLSRYPIRTLCDICYARIRSCKASLDALMGHSNLTHLEMGPSILLPKPAVPLLFFPILVNGTTIHPSPESESFWLLLVPRSLVSPPPARLSPLALPKHPIYLSHYSSQSPRFSSLQYLPQLETPWFIYSFKKKKKSVSSLDSRV